MAVLPLQRPQPDFEAVYQRHHQALYRYCRSILRHEQDAQDALQSTMARAFSALQDERREIELRPWLFRIAHNEAISILRRRRGAPGLGDAPGGGGNRGPHPQGGGARGPPARPPPAPPRPRAPP